MPPGNWSPGETVPRTGTYKCIFCGPDGMEARALKEAVKHMGIPYTPPPNASTTPPYEFFEEGGSFPSCPNCKDHLGGSDPTGWDFVSEEKVEGPKAGGCFIATACYGSGDSHEVMELRRFRDQVLESSRLGGEVVRCYYRVSPPIARFLQRHPVAKAVVRSCVVSPVYYLVRRKR